MFRLYNTVSSYFSSTPVVTTPVTTEIKPTATESKEDPTTIYKKRVAEYKEATKGYSPLFKHILYVLNKDNLSSSESITKVLNSMGSKMATFKGYAIHTFNETHRGNKCPFFKDTDLRPSLHLGTTRVWNHDGSFNEDRWKALIEATADKNRQYVSASKLHAYLVQCAAKDPEEKNTTGRYTSSVPFSRMLQIDAAKAAWDEVFDRLVGMWVANENSDDLEPCLTIEVLREFLEDSPVAYLRAECGLLPVKKPTMVLAEKARIAMA